MIKLKNKLVFAECLTDGTRIFHYLKPCGAMTLRVEVPKAVVPALLSNVLTNNVPIH